MCAACLRPCLCNHQELTFAAAFSLPDMVKSSSLVVVQIRLSAIMLAVEASMNVMIEGSSMVVQAPGPSGQGPRSAAAAAIAPAPVGKGASIAPVAPGPSVITTTRARD